MTPTQGIMFGEERLKALECKYELQLAKAEALGMRANFNSKPSMSVITQVSERACPDLQQTEDHYRTLFSENSERDKRDTPVFSE
ncbi:hypothetical protein TKK_0005002 [Trichogramma kaykai]|uniref:Uncharacterized protein n=1 Tax=Trichogramma kaykai TaxID=54128 RepID=A0ABD2XKF2_9HYME